MIPPLRIALVLGLLLAAASGAGAQEAAPVPDAAALEQRRAEVAARIEALDAAAGDGQRAALERLERALAQLLDAVRQGQELASELGEARSAAPAAPPGPPPYSVAVHQEALAAVSEAERVLEESEDAARVAATSLERARDRLQELEREQRLPGAADPDELRLEVAQTLVQLRRAQLASARRAVELHALNLERQHALLEAIGPQVRARPGERQAALARIDRREVALARQRDQLEQDLAAARRALGRAEATPGAAAEVAARRAEVSGLRGSVALLAERLDRLERERERAESRFTLFSEPPPSRATLEDWRDQSRAALESLSREAQLDRAELAALAQEAASLAGETGRWRELEAEALARTIEEHRAGLEALEADIRGERALQLALTGAIGSPGLADRLRQLGAALADLWTFEITSSEDRSITVGKVVVALVVFVLVVLLARLFTRRVLTRILGRAGVDEGAAHAYQSLFFYVLVAIAFLTALRFVDIPLTAFAVLGGALAIGVGFGSQTVVNNFISGVILLAERPIKRGDLVDVDGTYGNVEKIGLRSTRIRTGDNIHVIVPNSAFLENRVVNWTHNDAQVRLRLGVGVIYGSPTREVERLILQAVDEHERVMASPAPLVLFTEFGDNSLNFEVLFWVRVRSVLDRLRVESDVRYRIDDLFREAGLVIAFPQRDVHLDAAEPIPVQLVDGRAPGGEEG